MSYKMLSSNRPDSEAIIQGGAANRSFSNVFFVFVCCFIFFPLFSFFLLFSYVN